MNAMRNDDGSITITADAEEAKYLIDTIENDLETSKEILHENDFEDMSSANDYSKPETYEYIIHQYKEIMKVLRPESKSIDYDPGKPKIRPVSVRQHMLDLLEVNDAKSLLEYKAQFSEMHRQFLQHYTTNTLTDIELGMLITELAAHRDIPADQLTLILRLPYRKEILDEVSTNETSPSDGLTDIIDLLEKYDCVPEDPTISL